MLDVIRTIHPIGQGGFVSEYLPRSKHLVVYDCGALPKPDGKRVRLILGSLPKKDIDILFISHFDEDHVSLIPELKKRVESVGHKIKKVVIPLVGDNERMLLSQLYGDDTLKSMIVSPEKFFEDSVVVKVEPFTGHEEASEPIREEELVRPKISSGTCIVGNDWEYIPFNLKRQTRRKQFLKACRSEKINTRKLRNAEYVLSHITELQNVYNSSLIEGTINQNSMLLYSGALAPVNVTTTEWRNVLGLPLREFEPCFGIRISHINKAACLYTGDCDWSAVRVFHEYLGEERQKHIGLLQTPHHGSRGSYNKAAHGFLTSLEVDCFVQFGSKNNHGHPCMKVMCASRKAFMVTEKGVGIYPANW